MKWSEGEDSKYEIQKSESTANSVPFFVARYNGHQIMLMGATMELELSNP